MIKGLGYILSILCLPVVSISQDWGGLKPNGFWDHWSVNANIGLTSYFGDMSYHDKDIAGKISRESGIAYGLLVTKHFSKKIGVSGRLLYGNLQGENKKYQAFESQLLEYSLQVESDIIRVLFPHTHPKFGIEAHAGIGQMIFKTTKTENIEEIITTKEIKSRVPEFVYYFGGGAHYHFSDKMAVTFDLSLQHVQNDRLDDLVKNNDNDYYTYLRIGLTYYIESLKRSPIRNKARIANNGIRR